MPVVPPEQADKPISKVSPFFHFLWEMLQTLALALILFFLIDTFIARVYVENVSMLPNLQPGEFLLVNKYAYSWGKMQRGDVIIFHHPPDADYVKRLIGLPGDDIRMQNSQLFINGTAINEPNIVSKATYTGEWKVPEGMVFALGDNRNLSKDSHEFGFVPISSMVGKAILIYWPFDKIRALDDTIYVSQ